MISMRLRTLETGVETGSNANWLIRRPCSCVFCRLRESSLNFFSSAGDRSFVEDSNSRGLLSGSISSFVEAKRTWGDPVG